MTENQRQSFAIGHASRLFLRFDRARVAVRWEPVDQLIVEHDPDLPVRVDVGGSDITVVAERKDGDEPEDWGWGLTGDWWAGQHHRATSRPSRFTVGEGGVHVSLGPFGHVAVTEQGVDVKVETRLEALRGLVDWLFGGWRGGAEPVGLVLRVPLAVTQLEARGKRGTLVLSNLNGEATLHLRSGDLLVSGGRGHITASLGSGDVQVVDLQGDVDVQAGSGDITLSAIDGAIHLKGGSGDVMIEGGSGATQIAFGSGDVRYIDRIASSLVIQSGSGDIDLQSGRAQQTSVQLGSGDVISRLWLDVGQHEFVTGTGDVKISIPQNLPARIEVVARGDIDSDIPLVTVGQRGPRSMFGRRMVGSIGTGEPRAEILIRSGQGDVTLRWLASRAPSSPAAAPEPPTPPQPQPADTPSAPAEPAGPTVSAEPAAATTRTAGTETSEQRMSERAVLEALARGEISVAEAEELLELLSRRSE